jgi:hypothetical protein
VSHKFAGLTVYSPNQTCEWTIPAHDWLMLVINFDLLSLDSSNDCVTLLNGSHTLHQMCGPRDPTVASPLLELTPNHTDVRIRFTAAAGEVTNATGFRIRYFRVQGESKHHFFVKLLFKTLCNANPHSTSLQPVPTPVRLSLTSQEPSTHTPMPHAHTTTTTTTAASLSRLLPTTSSSSTLSTPTSDQVTVSSSRQVTQSTPSPITPAIVTRHTCTSEVCSSQIE